jgi:hypothetical protein
VLAEEPDLPDEAAVRVSLLEDDVAAPRIDERTAPRWLQELAGPFGEQARDELELQGPEAVRAVADQWERLSNEDRGWLIEWATEAIPDEPLAARLVLSGLESGDDELVLTALESAGELPDGAIEPGAFAPSLDHDRADLRAAAVAVGAPADLRSLLSAGAEDGVVVAALTRLGADGGPEEAEVIVPHLESDSLEIRNAARDALVSLGPDSIERLRPLVHSDSPETRAGAVRALLDLGDDEWLAEELLDEPSG